MKGRAIMTTHQNPGSVADRNFIRQQGLEEGSVPNCSATSSALLFQPRVVGPLVLLGVLLQSPAVFLPLAAVLWWSALLPRLNPFDALYNATLGRRHGAARLRPALAPRRFSQGMAGTFALATGAALLLGWLTTAYVLEGMFLVAAAAIGMGKFCLGSFIFYLVRGQASFAVRTLPWARAN
jgi:hypothetical protein